MTQKEKTPKEMLWYCPHCNKPFKSIGVALTLTVKCPHCGKLQNIRELHAAGRMLLFAGLAAWNRMMSLTDDLVPLDEEDAAFIAEFNAEKRIAHEIIRTMARDVEVLMYDENHKDYVAEEREQESYFKKNPGSIISRGKVSPF